MTNTEKIELIDTYCKVYKGKCRQFKYDLGHNVNSPEEIRKIAKGIEDAEIEALEHIKKVINSSNKEN